MPSQSFLNKEILASKLYYINQELMILLIAQKAVDKQLFGNSFSRAFLALAVIRKNLKCIIFDHWGLEMGLDPTRPDPSLLLTRSK